MGATPQSMQRYYAQRAAEYERVYDKPERQADIAALKAWLPPRFEDWNVLELACGTGYWTPHAALRAATWLATDINDEVLGVARSKTLPHERIRFARDDAYHPATPGRFDAAFAAFWWSHVPLERASTWIDTLRARLAPGSRVVLVDNRYVEGSNHAIARTDDRGNTYQQRRLADGSWHEVLKNFPSAPSLRTLLGPRASAFEWTEWTYFWACEYRCA